MEKVKVSIVEDNKVIRDNVSKFISFHEEFELGTIAHSADMFLDAFIITPANQTQDRRAHV